MLVAGIWGMFESISTERALLVCFVPSHLSTGRFAQIFLLLDSGSDLVFYLQTLLCQLNDHSDVNTLACP